LGPILTKEEPNMRRVFLCALVCGVAAMAEAPVARVTSSGSVKLSHVSLPAGGVSSLPVVAGDEIVTSANGALLVFSDRSRATIAPNSRVVVEGAGASVTLRVVDGSANLDKAGPAVSMIRSVSPAGPVEALGVGLSAAGAERVTLAASAAKKPPRSKFCPPPPGGGGNPKPGDCGHP